MGNFFRSMKQFCMMAVFSYAGGICAGGRLESESTNSSRFSDVAFKMGFSDKKHATSIEQQEALLQILNLAGYFSMEKLWHDIHHVGFADPAKVFKNISSSIIKSHAGQNTEKGTGEDNFDVAVLRKELFNGLSECDARDLLLYITQNAFDRTGARERNELVAKNWMHDNRTVYISHAQKLGLIDRVLPDITVGDKLLIAGASRIGVIARVIDAKYVTSLMNLKYDDVMVLAGARPLWAQLDGVNRNMLDAMYSDNASGYVKVDEISKVYTEETSAVARKTSGELAEPTLVGEHKRIPKSDNANGEVSKVYWHKNMDDIPQTLTTGATDNIAEGQEYMMKLAKKHHIAINTLVPFSTVNGRTYLNYEDPKGIVLNETLMSQDILEEFGMDAYVVDSSAKNNGNRPDTATTARDMVNVLLQEINDHKYGDKTHFDLFLQSNNPYIKRQELTVQYEVNKILHEKGLDKKYSITIHGMGFKNKQDVVQVHSELAALIYEMYKASDSAECHNTCSIKRDIKDLLFSTREEHIIPPYTEGVIGNIDSENTEVD
jgi:hypothetical protein